jgi:hypothetical protein
MADQRVAQSGTRSTRAFEPRMHDASYRQKAVDAILSAMGTDENPTHIALHAEQGARWQWAARRRLRDRLRSDRPGTGHRRAPSLRAGGPLVPARVDVHAGQPGPGSHEPDSHPGQSSLLARARAAPAPCCAGSGKAVTPCCCAWDRTARRRPESPSLTRAAHATILQTERACGMHRPHRPRHNLGARQPWSAADRIIPPRTDARVPAPHPRARA